MTARAVSSMSIATVKGIWRRSRTVEPPRGNRPRRASKTPKVALSRSYPDVGCLEDLSTACDGVALDRCDQRLL